MKIWLIICVYIICTHTIHDIIIESLRDYKVGLNRRGNGRINLKYNEFVYFSELKN